MRGKPYYTTGDKRKRVVYYDTIATVVYKYYGYGALGVVIPDNIQPKYPIVNFEFTDKKTYYGRVNVSEGAYIKVKRGKVDVIVGRGKSYEYFNLFEEYFKKIYLILITLETGGVILWKTDLMYMILQLIKAI